MTLHESEQVATKAYAGDDGIDHGEIVNFRGNPVDKSKTGGWLAAGLILGTELSERICVMGISMNLVTYLVENLHLRASKSATIVTNFMGTLNLLALLAGFAADAKLGRYATVAISASITALGVGMLTVATTLSSMRPPACDDYRQQHHLCTEASGKQLHLLFASLYTIAVGGGGIKANVSGFGSDQFDVQDPKEEKAMVFFFNRFYFSISLGSLFAVTVLVYIQDNVGRGWGYGISAATMVIAVFVLLGGTRMYRYRPPKGSPLTSIGKVVHYAWRKRNLAYPPHPSLLNEFHSAKVPHTTRFKCLDKAAIIVTNTEHDRSQIQEPHLSTMTQVEEVKMVLELLPIWSTCILFWTVYSQMTTFTIEQASIMDRKLGSFVVPAGSFSVCLFLTILLFTSLNERFFVPLARRITRSPHGLSSLRRVGIGLVFSILAMASAALVEARRRNATPRRISAFWLVPQFFLVGAGEAFAYVGQLEFFIREAPERMKSMSTGLFLSTLSLGFYVSSLLVSVVDKASGGAWIKSNFNMGRLDYFYWTLAVLSLFNFFVFLGFAKGHEYKVQGSGASIVASDGGQAKYVEKEVQVWDEEAAMEMPPITQDIKESSNLEK